MRQAIGAAEMQGCHSWHKHKQSLVQGAGQHGSRARFQNGRDWSLCAGEILELNLPAAFVKFSQVAVNDRPNSPQPRRNCRLIKVSVRRAFKTEDTGPPTIQSCYLPVRDDPKLSGPCPKQ